MTIYRFGAGGDEVIDQVGKQPSAQHPMCGHICHSTSPLFSRMVVPGCAGWFIHTRLPRSAQGPTLAGPLTHQTDPPLPWLKEAATATTRQEQWHRDGGQGRAIESCRGVTAGVLAQVEKEGPAKGGQTQLQLYHWRITTLACRLEMVTGRRVTCKMGWIGKHQQ